VSGQARLPTSMTRIRADPSSGDCDRPGRPLVRSRWRHHTTQSHGRQPYLRRTISARGGSTPDPELTGDIRPRSRVVHAQMTVLRPMFSGASIDHSGA
jgi:hypothetical protein